MNQETILRNEFGVRTFGYTSFIVDTDKTGFGGVPHRDGLTLTELRFTTTQQPGHQLYEYSCHEGNSAVGNALSGERVYDQAVADAKAKGLPIPPRTMGMEVYSGANVEGRQPVREVGFGCEP